MEITNQLKKRICKDFKLPINVFSEPYFEYFTDLYDSHYKVKEKMDWAESVLRSCKTQEDFFGMSESIATNIKNLIKSTDAYEKFNAADLSKSFSLVEQVKNQNIYIIPNVGKKMISVDLEKANFNCFSLFGLQDEIKLHTYSDLMKKFTGEDYFLNSKMIRQVIFGDLNPSRQQKVQKFIINNLSTELIKNGCKLTSSNSDEIIINDQNMSVEKVKDILKNVDSKFKMFRVEEFLFERIHPEHDFFIKTTIKNSGEQQLEFKNVPGHLHAQIFKKHYNLPVTENDLLFYHEGFLAQFKENLFKEELSLKSKMKI